MSNSLKSVLITGASKGIGKEIAKGLKLEGYKIFLTSRNIELLKETATEISADDFIVCDFQKNDDLENLEQFIEKNPIDILINNAGEYAYNNIENFSKKEIDEVFQTNLIVPTYLCAKVTKNMKTKKWGRIVNIGSISGVVGEAYASSYSSSKAGLIGLSKSLALELADKNITINTINPGWVCTQLGLNSIEDGELSLNETLETIPQKRFVEPKEIERLVNYLISEDAKGITGQSINLCAGLSVGC